MNKWVKKSAKFLMFALVVGCGGSQDPAAYNNELMVLINENEKHITDMNAAMNAADYDKASKIRSEWEAVLAKQQKKVEQLGDFNGDDSLQKGILTGLRAYEKIVKEDYVKLIDIRSSGADDAAAEAKALNNINNAFKEAASAVNAAGTKFQRNHSKK